VGFIAEAVSTDIKVDEEELEVGIHI